MSSLESEINYFGPGLNYSNSESLMGDARRYFAERIFGHFPTDPPERHVDLLEEGPVIDQITGEEQGFRRQLLVTLTRAERSIHVPVLIKAPSKKGPFKTILSANFWGNHSVDHDPGVIPSENIYTTNFPRLKVDFREEHRGWKRDQFDMERIIKPRVVDGVSYEYAAATFCYNDIVLDDPEGGLDHGAYALYPDLMSSDHAPGALNYWGFAMAQIGEAMSEDPLIANEEIGVMGFSRIAKSVHQLLAHRHPFSAAVAVASGKGGAGGLKNGTGEPSVFMAASRPHWFSKHMLDEVMSTGRLAFDLKYLLAMSEVPTQISVDRRDWWSAAEMQRTAASSANEIRLKQGKNPTIEFVTHSAGGHTVSPHWEEQYLSFFDRNL